MKKLDMTENEKEEDYVERKKDALEFLQRLRTMREKKRDWRYLFEKNGPWNNYK